MTLTIANRITISRIFLIPLFILIIIYYNGSIKDGHHQDILRYAALGIFALAFFMDALDGYIARTRKQISRLGTILDPFADKAMLLSALIMLSRTSAAAFEPHIPAWFVLTVISRDVVLVIGAMIIYYTMGNVTVRPRTTGKITTFFQMVVIIWVLAACMHTAFIWALGAATFFTIVSTIQYIFDGIKQLETE